VTSDCVRRCWSFAKPEAEFYFRNLLRKAALLFPTGAVVALDSDEIISTVSPDDSGVLGASGPVRAFVVSSWAFLHCAVLMRRPISYACTG
jgi:hypothetical protein